MSPAPESTEMSQIGILTPLMALSEKTPLKKQDEMREGLVTDETAEPGMLTLILLPPLLPICSWWSWLSGVLWISMPSPEYETSLILLFESRVYTSFSKSSPAVVELLVAFLLNLTEL